MVVANILLSTPSGFFFGTFPYLGIKVIFYVVIWSLEDFMAKPRDSWKKSKIAMKYNDFVTLLIKASNVMLRYEIITKESNINGFIHLEV